MLAEMLWVLGGLLFFVPYIVCKRRGIDMGHPPYGELHVIEDIIIMQRLEAARKKRNEIV